MARIRTSEVGLAVAVEGKNDAGALVIDDAATPVYQRETDDRWNGLEPNNIGALGANLSTTVRQPLSAGRQRLKGRITDLDSSVEFEADLTVDLMDRFAEGLLFAKATNSDIRFAPAAVTTSGYAIGTLTSKQVERMNAGALYMGYGFANAANNGMRIVETAVIAGANKSLTVRRITAAGAAAGSDDLVAENVAATAKRKPLVRYAGQMIPTSGVYTWAAGTKRLTITGITGAGTWGLTPGQTVHIGMTDGEDGVIHVPELGYHGYARVESIATDGTSVVLKDVSKALQKTVAANDSNVAALLFGEFVRNVDSSHGNYLVRSFAFEASFPNLDDSGDRDYEYPQGNVLNQFTINLPLTDKVTANLGFVGLDTPKPQVRRTKLDGDALSAFNPLTPIRNEIFNTTADMARLRVAKVDGDGITTDFRSVTFTLSNNATPDKALGTLGARDFDYGTFEASIQTQMVFTDPLVLDRVRDNDTVSMDFSVVNAEAAIVVELPTCTINTAGREYPLNRSVLLNTPIDAFAGDAGYTVGISIVPGAPNVARAVGESF